MPFRNALLIELAASKTRSLVSSAASFASTPFVKSPHAALAQGGRLNVLAAVRRPVALSFTLCDLDRENLQRPEHVGPENDPFVIGRDEDVGFDAAIAGDIIVF